MVSSFWSRRKACWRSRSLEMGAGELKQGAHDEKQLREGKERKNYIVGERLSGKLVTLVYMQLSLCSRSADDVGSPSTAR